MCRGKAAVTCVGLVVLCFGSFVANFESVEPGLIMTMKLMDAAASMATIERIVAAVHGQHVPESKFARARLTLQTLSRKEASLWQLSAAWRQSIMAMSALRCWYRWTRRAVSLACAVVVVFVVFGLELLPMRVFALSRMSDPAMPVNSLMLAATAEGAPLKFTVIDCPDVSAVVNRLEKITVRMSGLPAEVLMLTSTV